VLGPAAFCEPANRRRLELTGDLLGRDVLVDGGRSGLGEMSEMGLAMRAKSAGSSSQPAGARRSRWAQSASVLPRTCCKKLCSRKMKNLQKLQPRAVEATR